MYNKFTPAWDTTPGDSICAHLSSLPRHININTHDHVCTKHSHGHGTIRQGLRSFGATATADPALVRCKYELSL
jgi:hypothetical protein